MRVARREWKCAARAHPRRCTVSRGGVSAGRFDLAGVRVAVLRPSAQAAELGRALAGHGALPHYFPVIRIADSTAASVRTAADRLQSYDWIVFTSVNAVRTLAAAVSGWPPGPRIAAVGTGTAAALRAAGIRVDLVPERYEAGALAAALSTDGGIAGRRVLFPRAREARRTLPDTLAAAGAIVDEVECYRTEIDFGVAGRLCDALAAGELDALLFTSPSQVRALLEAGCAVPAAVVVAAVGPVTAARARGAGMPVHVVAETHSMAGLTDALATWYASMPGADGRGQ
jgi:uroporphyrinogen III methyltransferase / synthase